MVGALEHEFYDFPVGNGKIIPTDDSSILFQRGGLKHQPVNHCESLLTFTTLLLKISIEIVDLPVKNGDFP